MCNKLAHSLSVMSCVHPKDYVKWRGLLLHRFLATLVDSDASVRDLGLFTLTRPLINKVKLALVTYKTARYPAILGSVSFFNRYLDNSFVADSTRARSPVTDKVVPSMTDF